MGFITAAAPLSFSAAAPQATSRVPATAASFCVSPSLRCLSSAGARRRTSNTAAPRSPRSCGVAVKMEAAHSAARQPFAERSADEADDAAGSGSSEKATEMRQQQRLGTVLVVGASGRTGREVVQKLREGGVCRCIRAVVRDAGKFQRDGATAAATAAPPSSADTEIDVRAIGDLGAASDGDLAQLVDGVDAVLWVAGATSGSSEQQQQTFAPDQIDYGALQHLVRVATPSLRAREPSEYVSVLDFGRYGAPAAAAFKSVDDVVMGGRSDSTMQFDASEDDGRGAALFRGKLSTEYGGGFAQERCQASTVLAAGANGYGSARLYQNSDTRLRDGLWDLGAYDGIAITVRGDGRRYKFNLTTADTDHDASLLFQQAFDTERRVAYPGAFGIGGASDDYETHFLPFSAFIPMRRGRPVYGEGNALYGVRLDARRIRSVGVIVSKVAVGGGTAPDFAPGEFRLACTDIGAYRAAPPRLVVLSSAGVTRLFWSEQQKRAHPAAVNIAIVNLNPSNVLGFKLKGEDAVRTARATRHGDSSGAVLPYAIVRPVGLNEDVRYGRAILAQGDTMSGRVPRAMVADVMVSALRERDAFCKTFELSQAEAGEAPLRSSGAVSAYGEALRALRVDVARRVHP